MNRSAIVLALVLSAAPLASLAQSGGMKGMDMKDMDMKPDSKAAGQTHHGKGTVSKVDAAAGTVTINHEPIASINWPSMSMQFKVKDKALLKKTTQGQKVEFSFVQSGKDYVVTDIK